MQAEDFFIQERRRLVGLAYRMVGSVSDAEDIVSEAWARWCAIEASELDSPRAWLTTVTTRLAIDWLRRARHDRETYVGPWLPEPVVTEPGPEERAELADSLTLGFLTLLDRLDPVERAVFLMADVFEVTFTAIAQAVDKSPAACRHIASRARRSLRFGRVRARPRDRHVVDEVLVALALGDMEAVLVRLAPGVVCVTDGGAYRYAARRPVVGADRVARFLTKLAQRYSDQMTAEKPPSTASPASSPGSTVRSTSSPPSRWKRLLSALSAWFATPTSSGSSPHGPDWCDRNCRRPLTPGPDPAGGCAFLRGGPFYGCGSAAPPAASCSRTSTASPTSTFSAWNDAPARRER